MRTITVETKQHQYPIYIGQGLLKQKKLFEQHITSNQIMIVTNDKVGPLYLSSITAHFSDIQCDSVILPDGEQHKTLDNLNRIFDKLLANKHHRTATIIALGGGVVGDVAGFAAACYQRGIAFIQVPTTLLAQVDASVGGKTAVNHPLGKNMIGAFHQPNAVITDLSVLQTLEPREYKAGLAEVVKHALIADLEFFQWLESNADALLNLDSNALEYTVAKCCEIKAKVVAEDEREKDLRAILNFGHTVGHAIESTLGYGTWLHGEAVAVGMVIAAQLSHELGWLKKEDIARITLILEKMELPSALPKEISIEQLMDSMAMDKKVSGHQLRFILLKSLGQAAIHRDMDVATLKETIATNLE